MQHSGSGSQIVEFARETEGLPEARAAELVELADGDECRRPRSREGKSLASALT